MYVIGLDLGTSSLKAILLRDDGSVATTATECYAIQTPEVGWAEQDPADWWRAAVMATRRLLANVGAQKEDIVGIGLSGQMHGTVTIDDHNEVLRPAIIWPDRRTRDEAPAAEVVLKDHGLLARLGGGVAAGFMLPTLLWIRDQEPHIWSRIKTALLPKDYLRLILTGNAGTEPTDGTGIPLIDLYTGTWCIDAVTALGLPEEILPTLGRSCDSAGALTVEAAAALGLSAGTPVLYGGSDQAMGAVGAGLLAPGDVLISLSSGGQIITPLSAPLSTTANGLRTLYHVVPQTYLALAATLGAGLSFNWLLEHIFMLSDGERETVLLEAATVPAGANGLLFLPYIMGERTPIMDPGASGAWIGLTANHGRAHIVRSVLEGIALSMRDALTSLKETGLVPARVIVAGGLARIAMMQGIVADTLAMSVVVLETGEQSALGAALGAATHAGFYSSINEACGASVSYSRPVVPRGENVGMYRDMFGVYQGIYPALSGTMHKLRTLST